MPIDDDVARRLLAEERRLLETDLGTVEGDRAEERAGAGDELASYDQHPAEMGTEVSYQEQDLGLREDFQELLRENEEAMRRLEDGVYGRCEVCGRPIEDDRLRNLPSTRYCVEHAREQAVPTRLDR